MIYIIILWSLYPTIRFLLCGKRQLNQTLRFEFMHLLCLGLISLSLWSGFAQLVKQGPNSAAALPMLGSAVAGGAKTKSQPSRCYPNGTHRVARLLRSENSSWMTTKSEALLSVRATSIRAFLGTISAQPQPPQCPHDMTSNHGSNTRYRARLLSRSLAQ